MIPTEGQSLRTAKMQEIILNKEKSVSTEFKTFFLLEFTKQLIFNSAPMEVLKLKEIINDKYIREAGKKVVVREDVKNYVKETLKAEEQVSEHYEKSPFTKEKYPEGELIEKKWAKPKIKKKSFPFETFKNIRLTIPEPNLPERLRYLKPTPIPVDMDVGSLNPLMKDPHVRTVECAGPGKAILVTGTMGEKKTNIILDENEINDIINRFSIASKIPISEGVYKVAVGRTMFMAIISEIIGSKFIIKKMVSNYR